MSLVFVTIWDCRTHVRKTSSVERTDLNFKISVALVYTVCHSVSIIWTHHSMVELHGSNFRVITTNVLVVRIFRKFRVCCYLLFSQRYNSYHYVIKNTIKYEPRHNKTCLREFPTRPDTNRPQKLARVLKFRL